MPRNMRSDTMAMRMSVEYSSHTVPYGIHADDRAGDQYYHFPLRQMARALLRGKTADGLEELKWAAGDAPFFEQAASIGRRCENAVDGWKGYLNRLILCQEQLSAQSQALLSDTLLLQAILHQTGCEGMRDFCHALSCIKNGEEVQAYLYANRALEAHRRGVRALERVEHGEFQNIYRNECFTNIRLTVQVLTAVRAYLRICFDGNNLYDWEKQYLTPREDNLVVCLTHRHNQLDDDALCAALEQVIALAT